MRSESACRDAGSRYACAVRLCSMFVLRVYVACHEKGKMREGRDKGRGEDAIIK